jgi:acylphosphatase
MNSTKRISFSGRVQGVGFRYTTKQLALGFDIVGSVRNREDGTVELKVMGDEKEVSEFITEIVEESELASLIKEHHISEIDQLADCRGFTITN